MTDDRDEHLSKLNASDDLQSPADPRADQSEGGSSRRRFVKAGLTAVPIIFTLRSRSAWGQGPVPIAGTQLTNANNSVTPPPNPIVVGDDLSSSSDESGFFQDPWADDGAGGGEDGDDF